MRELIMVDSDGVLHNWDAHVESISGGVHPKAMKDPEMWALIATVPDFWLTMPVMPEAQELYDGLCHHNLVVLSGCPKSGYHLASQHKKEKFSKNFPGLHVLTCPSRYKPLMAATYLGMVEPSVMDMAVDVFLDKLSGSELEEAKAELKVIIDGLDLRGTYLVDDMQHNLKRWVKAKGNGILFRNTKQALSDFEAKKYFVLK